MRFLNNLLKGREAALIDPAKAQDFTAIAEKFGFSDMISKLLGARPEAYVTENGVGVIPVSGVIGKGLSPLEKMVGAVDVNDIASQIDAFEADPAVTGIAFDISSPGGTVTGVEELAKKIRNISVPTMAYTDSEMASAAYWLGSQADQVIASPSSTVGSVGVYLVVPDMTEAYRQMGVEMKVIKAGKFKAAGLEGTSLTPDQVANLQAGVDEIHADFRSAVKAVRSRVKDDAMEGQVFSGKQAAQLGLVTGLADSFAQAMSSAFGGKYSEGSKAVVASVAKKAQAALTPKASDVEDSVLELLSPRQRSMVDELGDIEETFGMWDQSSGPEGAHYVAASPFAKNGLLCQNCVFYRGPRGCGLVSGDIDPNGICKLWVIPGSLIKE